MSDSVQTEHLYVQRNPTVCGGDPVVAGTRIPVRLIYLRARTGQSIDVIQQAYPSLRTAQIYDALSYAHDHLAEIEEELRREDEAYAQGDSTPSA